MGRMAAQEIEFADTAPLRAEGSAMIAASPAEIWAVLLDYEAWPTWFAGVRSCRATSDPATGVGSTRTVSIGGGSTFDERFIAWDEGRLWAFTGIEMKPLAIRSLVERVTIEDLGPNRTRVTYRMAFDPKPAVKPMALLARPLISRNLAKAMRALAREVVSRR
ncbi:SRPBCC family protein [soil metagenome]